MMPIEVEKPSSRARVVDGPRIFRVLDPAAEHRVDVHVEGGVVVQVLELLVEQAQALLRHLVRLDVVDADLQEVEAGGVRAPRSASHQEVAVGDQAGHHAAARMRDQHVEVRVQHRLAAAEGDDRRAELGRACRSALHHARSAPAATPCRTRCSSRSRCCSGGSG
jgi:hypothetical protein